MKVVKHDKNKAGTIFAIQRRGNGFVVIKQCKNYQAGRIVEVYRVCLAHRRQNNDEFQKMAREGMTREAAETLYNKKLAGKQK